MTVWVLLRGLARDARHWENLPAYLSRRTGCEVQAIDLPGNGTLYRERSPCTIAAMVESARSEVERRCVQGPVRLLGLSMGAMVAMEWASRYPSEVAGAVLVNGSTRDDGWPWMRLRPAAWWSLCRALCTQDAARREHIVIELCSNANPSPALVAKWAAHATAQPPSVANVLRQLLAAARYRRPPEPPPVPILVMASAADRLVSRSCSMRLARAWGLPICLHPSAGHELPLDATRWLVQVCASWQRRAGSTCLTPVMPVTKVPS